MITIQLSEVQRKNLLVFLNRVQLNGQEVPAFMEVIQVIATAKNKEQPGVKSEEQPPA